MASAFLLIAAPLSAAEFSLPPAAGQFDYQLGEAYTPPQGTGIVGRDRTDPPAKGLYNICYVNAFQTQPHETSWWQQHHADLLLTKADGTLVEDPDWPGEILLDTGSPIKREALLAITGAWIDQCAHDGYQAVEADNLDTYSRSAGALSMTDNLAYGAALAARAHANGMAFGQKNGAELGTEGREAGFDFAVVESCQVYAECSAYTDIFGAMVLEIEYTDTDPANFAAACLARGKQISVIRRDRNLTIPTKVDYFYQTC